MKKFNDTIAAISTPAGEGGIAVVRVSGDDALKICSALFKSELSEIEKNPNKMFLRVLDTGEIKDEVLCVYFKSPLSYTGEDVLEIHCHGSFFIAASILKSLIGAGARQASAGEFTKRAFYNQKIDLTKAEGILDLIKAQSESEVNAAFYSVKGGLYKAIEGIRSSLAQILTAINAELDFPDEIEKSETEQKTEQKIAAILTELKELKDSFKKGIMIKNGVKAVIIGEPNAGKSSILNRLLNRERAIVSPIAGTTRDALEDVYIFNGVRFIITDTAGLRKTDGIIEKEGINRALEAAKEADIILLVTDASNVKNLNGEFIKAIKNKTVLNIFNKSDLIGKSDVNKNKTDGGVYISALKDKNLDGLMQKIYDLTVGNGIGFGGAAINNLRHYEAVIECENTLKNASDLKSEPLEITAAALTAAYGVLGKITGAAINEEIIDGIFKNFCVGK